MNLFKSLSENSEGRCGEGFWLWPRRRGRSIPAAGCDGRANAGHRQKTRRPEGFRGKGRLASLLLSRRSTRDILLRRASPDSLFHENSAFHNFQTGSKLRKSGSAARRGFTIIEIAICLGIIGFALVAIIAALPRGLDVQKRNREETIIGHDEDIWMSSLRSGARGYDELTNYVLCITNFWTTYNPNLTVVNSGVDYYTPTTSSRTSINPATGDFPLTNGAHIIGLLSTPKFTPAFLPPATEQFQSNYVVAYVRAISGSAADKSPETNTVILGDAFIYRMIVENFPTPVDTNGICMDCVYTNGLSKDQMAARADNLKTQAILLANTHDLRLKFRWPVLPGGRVLDFNATFRTMADGVLTNIPDPAVSAQPLYFIQASTFVTNSLP